MSQDVSSDVRLSMTRNARAWRAGMVTTGAAVNPSERALPHVRSRVARGRTRQRISLASTAGASFGSPGVR